MNIFYLDEDPVVCARQHCDKHVLKMILEYSTLLRIAQAKVAGRDVHPSMHRYQNHPCAKWARESLANYQYLQKLFYALLDEYHYRWGKAHKWEAFRGPVSVNQEWILEKFPKEPFTEPPQCMPGEFRAVDTKQAYRDYYAGAKTHLLKYTRRHVPEFLDGLGLGEHK